MRCEICGEKAEYVAYRGVYALAHYYCSKHKPKNAHRLNPNVTSPNPVFEAKYLRAKQILSRLLEEASK